ncbi:hypothetical protein MMC25_004436 [Agyrium rufum]|nr:hypothetical protein [Agyrium rufum]
MYRCSLSSALLLYIFSVLFSIPIVLGANPTSFCKCTCFKINSTIIALDGPSDAHFGAASSAFDKSTARSLPGGFEVLPRWAATPDTPNNEQVKGDGTADGTDAGEGSGTGDKRPKPGIGGGIAENGKQLRPGNCGDCNKQFCLEYHLPGCTGAGLDDVATVCFQRDSTKDQTVVFIFIIATAGLLIWALIGPWAERWIQGTRQKRSYIPLSNAPSQG